MPKKRKRLGKLATAFLEGFIGKSVGEKFVDELRSEFQDHENLIAALESTEEAFRRQCKDEDFKRLVSDDLPITTLPSLREALSNYARDPSEPELVIAALTGILSRDLQGRIPGASGQHLRLYVRIFAQKLAILDPTFRAKIDTMLRFEHLTAAKMTLEAVLEAAKDTVAGPPNDSKARSAYLAAFVRVYSGPEPPAGLDLGPYVALPIELSDAAGKDQQAEVLDDAFSVSMLPRRWMLLGEVGSGKTATLRQLASLQAKRCLEDPNAPLPVLIDLWTWRGAQSSFASLFEGLIHDAPDESIYGLLRSFHESPVRLLQGNKISLYLDALDELPDSQVRVLKNWLAGTNVSVGITCRQSEFIGIRKFDLPTITIRPLAWQQIAEFAARYLGPTQAPQFVSNILDPKPGERAYDESHIAQFVQTPFLLLLMLAYYRESRTIELNRWKLFQFIVQRLWNADRVQELLTLRGIAREYSDAEQIAALLAHWGVQYLESRVIPRGPSENYIPVGLEDALLVSGLLQIGVDQVRFRHPLFAEYFAAYQLLNNEALDSYVSDGARWAGALVVLASHGARQRKLVQNALLRAIPHRHGTLDYIEEKRGPLWALGEIGDANAIATLLELHRNLTLNAEDGMIWFMTSSANMQFAGTSFLIAASRIAGRLPEKDASREQVVEIIEAELSMEPRTTEDATSESSMPHEIVGSKEAGWQIYQLQLLNVWNAVLAAGEVGGREAADLLHTALVRFAELYPPPTLFSGNVRRYGFAVALARLGRAAIPVLLRTLFDDNPLISHAAAEALDSLRYALPLPSLHKLLALHPDSVIRSSVARTIGRMKSVESVPHLIAALNDPGMISMRHPMTPWDTRHYYLADSVALALASIGTQECLSTITERLYDPDGTASLQLSLERIRDQNDLAVRTFEARQVIQRFGVANILPLMGHLGLPPHVSDPIAEAITKEHERLGSTIDEELTAYLTESEDIPSRAWALIILGRKGNLAVAKTLRQCLASECPSLIRGSAAHGLGILVSRNLDAFDVPGVLGEYLEELGRTPEHNYGGVGLGIAEIVKACMGLHDEVPERAIRSLLARLSEPAVEHARAALDALESIDLALDSAHEERGIRNSLKNLIQKELKSIVTESPSHMLKIADSTIEQAAQDNNRPMLEKALGMCSMVLQLKHDRGPAWALRYDEHDWAELGCADAEVHCRLGEILYKLARYPDSLTHYQKVIADIDADELSSQRLAFLLGESAWKAGAIHVHSGQCDEALPLFSQVTDLRDGLISDQLALSGWLGLQRAYLQTENWPGLLATEDTATRIADATYSRYRERVLVRFNLGVAHARLGSPEKARDYYERAENLASHYGLRDVLVEVLLHRGALEFALGREDEASKKVQAAEAVYTAIENWPEAADALQGAAFVVYGDQPDRSIPLYERALAYQEISHPEPEKQASARLLNQLALAYEQVHRPDDAEKAYRRGIHTLDGEQMSGVQSVLFLDYGRFLHRTGRTGQGNAFALRGIGIQAALGLDESYAESVLYEMSTNPEWKIPSAIVQIMLEDTVGALTAQPESKAHVYQRLEDMLKRARHQHWAGEEEFLIAVSSLLEGQNAELPSSNPYTEPFEDLKNALATASTSQEEGRFLTLGQLLDQVDRAIKGDKSLGEQLFPGLQRMAADSSTPAETRALSRILVSMLAGVRNPSLDGLSDELASAIRTILKS